MLGSLVHHWVCCHLPCKGRGRQASVHTPGLLRCCMMHSKRLVSTEQGCIIKSAFSEQDGAFGCAGAPQDVQDEAA